MAQSRKVLRSARAGVLALLGAVFLATPAAAERLPDRPPLFGSSEHWIGFADRELAANRYQRLTESLAGLDADGARKWSILTRLIRSQRPINQLRLVQQFFSTQPYETDEALYNVADHWASVGEFLKNGGDCEDFAIAKYRALTAAGYPPDSLRIVLVTDTITNEPHAVLAAYLGDEVYILDNQRIALARDVEIGNYRPLYSLNEFNVWSHRGQPTAPIASLALSTRAK